MSNQVLTPPSYMIKKAQQQVEYIRLKKKQATLLPIAMCFNGPSKSYFTISIYIIYESSNFSSTDLIQLAIHSG